MICDWITPLDNTPKLGVGLNNQLSSSHYKRLTSLGSSFTNKETLHSAHSVVPHHLKIGLLQPFLALVHRSPLQLIQRAASRRHRFSNITPSLCSLHCLPVAVHNRCKTWKPNPYMIWPKVERHLTSLYVLLPQILTTKLVVTNLPAGFISNTKQEHLQALIELVIKSPSLLLQIYLPKDFTILLSTWPSN